MSPVQVVYTLFLHQKNESEISRAGKINEYLPCTLISETSLGVWLTASGGIQDRGHSFFPIRTSRLANNIYLRRYLSFDYFRRKEEKPAHEFYFVIFITLH